MSDLKTSGLAAIVAMAASIAPAAADYRTCMEFCIKEHGFSRCNETCAGQAGQAGIAPKPVAKPAGDCSTINAKGDVILEFIEKHYGNASVMTFPSDHGLYPSHGPGVWEVYFHPYYPQERDCEGAVKVDDDCRITDAEGASLDRAASRERVFRCTLSSG